MLTRPAGGADRGAGHGPGRHVVEWSPEAAVPGDALGAGAGARGPLRRAARWLALAKRAIDQGLDGSLGGRPRARAASCSSRAFGTEDATIGVQSFLEQRPGQGRLRRALTAHAPRVGRLSGPGDEARSTTVPASGGAGDHPDGRRRHPAGPRCSGRRSRSGRWWSVVDARRRRHGHRSAGASELAGAGRTRPRRPAAPRRRRAPRAPSGHDGRRRGARRRGRRSPRRPSTRSTCTWCHCPVST